MLPECQHSVTCAQFFAGFIVNPFRIGPIWASPGLLPIFLPDQFRGERIHGVGRGTLLP
ncbi:hypothetical protein L210DRAFT_942981 [Boletus edulis BED1]|uniref:Uncharacterized protein n=1 Tax=Boletus edulis BED1 TaxID=1328754 RepID=A0AAD4BG22_BOLED|nr:hypothetical protein L210DRAFT_942981 [Boletus edulis BED1]